MTQTRHTILRVGETTDFQFVDENNAIFRVTHEVKGDATRTWTYTKFRKTSKQSPMEGIGLSRKANEGKRGAVLLFERPLPPIGRTNGLYEVFAINGF